MRDSWRFGAWTGAALLSAALAGSTAADEFGGSARDDDLIDSGEVNG